MKVQNPFRLGLYGGLGVLVAIVIGSAVASLATILTYVGAALFLALGIDPIVSWLERHRWPRWVAILVVLVVILGVFAALVLSIVPVIIEQSTRLITDATAYAQSVTLDEFYEQVQKLIPSSVLNVRDAANGAISYLTSNAGMIGTGILSVGVTIANGAFGGVIVLILTLYFVSSLGSIKRALYRLVPATQRARFTDIAEQISQAVGKYVMGQVALALCNGVLSFIYLTIIGAAYPALFAFIAFLFSLIPLVGTITGSVLIVLTQFLVNPGSLSTVIAAGIYYLIYMQVEAYVLSPNIMNRAVKVPGVVVVIAALIGGTLLGILGALIAVPVAASLLIIVNQVIVPRQNEL